jgi:hypothetical protein
MYYKKIRLYTNRSHSKYYRIVGVVYMKYKLLALGIVLVSLLLSGCSFLTNNMGYSFSKTHDIVGSPDSALSGYPVQLVIHRDIGNDSGQDVYLNGHSQSWPNDIRFVNSKGSLLDYWIESYDDYVATVWVKMDAIPVSPGIAALRLYYGKAGDQGASSGDRTFLVFDDFKSGTIDTNKWTVSNSSSIINDGIQNELRLVPNGTIRAVNLNSSSFALMTKIKFESFGINGPRILAWMRVDPESTTTDSFKIESRPDGSGWTGTSISRYPGDVTLIRERPSWKNNTWYRMDLKSSPTYSEWDTGNNDLVLSTEDSGDFSGTFQIGAWESGQDVRISWIAVRPYTRNEPTHGAWSNN